MIRRHISEKLYYYATKYPVVTLTGPRQSGKSTLLRHLFPDYHYVSLEDPDILLMAGEDPRLFLQQNPDKTIIDEAQRLPELFSYLQSHIDRENREGMYLLSGSQNFLMMERISQTLAGRTAILNLLPFSMKELDGHELLPDRADRMLLAGFYPRIYDKGLQPDEFYPFYTRTYLERDVRQVKNITDMQQFTRFLKLCAGRTGQLLNLSSLANDCGITQPTAKAWLSVLETSYVIYLLKPYYKNFNKRLTKSPKLYFLDTGLACSLLGISSEQALSLHHMRGALFESMIISEVIKCFFNEAREPALWFWRDHTGNEIDLLLEESSGLYPVEIKSGLTYSSEYFRGLSYWRKLAPDSISNFTVVYGGDESRQTPKGKLLPWRSVDELFEVP